MDKQVETNFWFVDSRNYVHSSSIVEEIARHVFQHFYSEESWQSPMVDVFLREEISTNGSFILTEDRNLLREKDLGSCFIKFYDSNKMVFGLFIEDNSSVIISRIRTNYVIEDLDLTGRFSGKCYIDCTTRPALVENVIEANKRLHLMSIGDRSSSPRVVNLYMKRFPVSIPQERVLNPHRVQMRIENIGMREGDVSISTLCSFSFPEIAQISFEIAFIVYGVRSEIDR